MPPPVVREGLLCAVPLPVIVVDGKARLARLCTKVWSDLHLADIACYEAILCYFRHPGLA
jgi:hypothetical protein